MSLSRAFRLVVPARIPAPIATCTRRLGEKL